MGDVIISDSARTWRVASKYVVDQRVINKWCQPLRSSKNAPPPPPPPPKEAFVDIVWQDPVPRKRSSTRRRRDSAKKTCSGRPRKRRPTEMEFDHKLRLELRLWLKSKRAERLTSTLAWKAGQRRAVEK